MRNNSQLFERIFIITTFITGFTWMLCLCFLSTGTPLHDEIGHYLISRDVPLFPLHIFDAWGRTINTLLYVLPAQFGLAGARIFSLILACFTALITLKIARIFKLRYAFLTPLLLIFQPWFIDLSYLCITEVPFSLCMVLGIWLALKKHTTFAALILGILPLIRHEGIALSGLFALYLIFVKDWRSLLTCMAPLIMYNVTYVIFQGSWPLLLYFQSKPSMLYGHGSWFHYLVRLPHPRAIGIPITLLLCCSTIPLAKHTRKKTSLSVIMYWYASYFLLHTVIFRFGLFASGGYKLFLLPIAPAVAIAATLGLEWLVDTCIEIVHRFHISLITHEYILGIVCGTCIIFSIACIKPYTLSEQDLAVQKAAHWVREHRTPNQSIASTHVYFYYFLPLSVPPVTLWEKFPPLKKMAVGTIFVWDAMYSDKWGYSIKYFAKHSREWKRVQSFDHWHIIVYEKIL